MGVTGTAAWASALLSRSWRGCARAFTDDHELVRLLRAGDEDAFETLVQRHHAAMVRLARGSVRRRAVAEEVAQEAWLGLLRGLDGFEGRSSLRTWLFRIVVNRAISTGIRERVHLPVQDSELEADNGRFSQDGWWVTPPAHWAEEVVDRLTAPDLAARVHALIERLPAGQLAAVTLRDVRESRACKHALFSGSRKATSGCSCTAPAPGSGPTSSTRSSHEAWAKGPRHQLSQRPSAWSPTTSTGRSLELAMPGSRPTWPSATTALSTSSEIQVTVAAAGRVRDDDLDPRVRQDLMNLYRRWRGDRPG